MTGKKETGATWHHTTVALRADIYRQALEQGIDISDACNRALAGLTGNDYVRQQQETAPAAPPVIIAGNGASPVVHRETKNAASRNLHPVINADDPAAPAKVVQAKTPAKKAPSVPVAPVPVPVPAMEKERPVPAPEAAAGTTRKPAARKEKAASAKKRTKSDALRTFFSSKIERTDDAGATVSKDELYELFARFCREHHLSPVPERKAVTIALKNQFALTEKMADGTACWTGIRLK